MSLAIAESSMSQRSSCQQLRSNCKDFESGERVRRICPATCGICPGAPLSAPTAVEVAAKTPKQGLETHEAISRPTCGS